MQAKHDQSDWPKWLDAVIAAPDHHKVIFENETVRVLDTLIRPGETVPVHTHSWPSVVYAVSSEAFIRYDGKGNVVMDSRTVDMDLSNGTVVWLPSLSPHSIENVGNKDIRSTTVEIKTA